MIEESNYWKRLAKRRLSRRRLLVGAMGVGAGLTAASLVGCQGEEEGAGTPVPLLTPQALRPGEPPEITPFLPDEKLEPVKEGSRGGILRWYGYDALPPDSYDPHQTQFGPVYSMHSSVFSKVLRYDDIPSGKIVPDLAESVPEPVDQTTYVIKIRPGVRFHNHDKARKMFPDLAGRELTGEDVKYSILRQVNEQSPKAGRYYRKSQWQTVDKIEVGPDPLTVTITTKRPTAPFIHFLADTNAFVIGKEVVDEELDDMNHIDKMIGTGPFFVQKYVALQVCQFRKNPDWFAKDDLADQGLPDRPIVDGYDALWPVQDDTATEAAFKSKQIDGTGYVDARNAYRIAGETGAEIDRAITSGWVGSRFLVVDSARADTPFEDVRLRKAISLVVDRRRLGEQMFGEGFYVLGCPVGQAITAWTLPYEELIKKPGYRFRREEREEDIAEARRLWEAANGSAVPTVEMVIAGIPDYIPNTWPQFKKMIADNLGYEFSGHIDSTGYTELDQCLLEKSCIFGFGYDNGWIDLDDWVYPYFYTDGPKNSFNLSDAKLDALLDAQRAEFDYEKRRALGFQIQHYLLDELYVRLDYAAPSTPSTQWGYYRNRRPQPWFGNTFHVANQWLDRTHPQFQGRPA